MSKCFAKRNAVKQGVKCAHRVIAAGSNEIHRLSFAGVLGCGLLMHRHFPADETVVILNASQSGEAKTKAGSPGMTRRCAWRAPRHGTSGRPSSNTGGTSCRSIWGSCCGLMRYATQQCVRPAHTQVRWTVYAAVIVLRLRSIPLRRQGRRSGQCTGCRPSAACLYSENGESAAQP